MSFDPFGGSDGGGGSTTSGERVRYTIVKITNDDIDSFRLRQTIDGASTNVGETIKFAAKDVAFDDTDTIIEASTVQEAIAALEELIGASKIVTIEVNTPKTTWTLQHKLKSKYPTIILLDENDNIIFGDITFNSEDVSTVTFCEAVKGKAIIKK